MGRGLLLAAGGGARFPGPPAGPPLVASGPYDPAWSSIGGLLMQAHCHTTNSDGDHTPAEVVAGYLARGYDILALTDHDKHTTQPAGIDIPIAGDEYSPSTNHIVGLASPWTRSGQTDAQEIIDAIVGSGGQAHVAHPTWSTGMTYDEMAVLTGYLGLEVFNAHCIGSASNPISHPGYALDRWDQLLQGVSRGLWGYAVDDWHTDTTFTGYDLGRLIVFPEGDAQSDVIAALVAGNFMADVANYGVTPSFPVRSDDGVDWTATGATRIEAYGPGNVRLQSSAGTSISHAYDPALAYVRLEAVGDYDEQFSSARDDRWHDVDAGVFTVSGGKLVITAGETAVRTMYRPARAGDFDGYIDCTLTGGGNASVALIFNAIKSGYLYILRIGDSSIASWANKLAFGHSTTNNFAGAPAAAVDYTAAVDEVIRVKFDYTAVTGRMRAKAWQRDNESEPGDWMLDGTDTTWRHGLFGIRGNRACTVDRLYLNGFRTYTQPIAVDPA